MTTKISNVAARAMLQAIVDLFDSGSYVKIYTGTQPAGGPDATETGSLLATITMNATPWGTVTDANPGATVSANSMSADTSADATGTAGWFRAYDSNNTPIIDGAVGEAGSGAEMILDEADITVGGVVTIASWTLTLAESAA